MARILLSVLAAACICTAAGPEDYFRAIRAGDDAALAALIASGGVNQANHRGTTPLHYAASFGSDAAVARLLAGGAKPDAANLWGATPLILAASSPAKIRMLLAAGADPNAATKEGRTPLIIAAGRPGTKDAVKLLLDRGARVQDADGLGITPLLAAADKGDEATLRLLIARGARVADLDKRGSTSLQNAIQGGNPRCVRLLLQRRVDVNAANHIAGEVRHGKVILTNLTPLILAAAHDSERTAATLLKAGAKVNVQDGRGMTPLMTAAASERQNLRLVECLLKAGADPNMTDMNGETALDWARKVGNPAMVRRLEAAGAKCKPLPTEPVRSAPPADVRESIVRAAGLLQKTSTEFFAQTGCIACHHQNTASRAEAAARAAGVPVGDEAAREQARSMKAMRPREIGLLQFIAPGGGVMTIGSMLWGAEAAGVPADSLTDASVAYIAAEQHADGSWKTFGLARPPIEDSNITMTALAMSALRAYGWPARRAEFEQRVARARAWLMRQHPATTYEQAELALALHESKAPHSAIQRVATALLTAQDAGGGWRQQRYGKPDAYATGMALNALHTVGALSATDERFKRGVDFLLRTQLDDGSWYVRSRAAKFQPYFQSGFPHDHDQWISAAATAYAVMALAPAAR